MNDRDRDDSDWLANVPRRSTPPRTTARREPARASNPERRVPAQPSAQARTQARAPRPASAPVARRQGSRRPDAAPGDRPRAQPSRARTLRRLLALAVVLLLAIPPAAAAWVEFGMARASALSGAAATPGTTYLIVGSDSREGWAGDDGIEGARTDTIIVMHRPVDGPLALVSLPRDTLVDIPGHGPQKINAAYAFGGAPLLVRTVEGLTGLTIDHYVEVGFGAVEGVVDALGGVELCLDRHVSDRRSDLEWTAGCHVADGATALAFARMRYSDPLGDIGRASRQQQLIEVVGDRATSRETLSSPTTLWRLLRAGIESVRVSDGTHVTDLYAAARALDDASAAGAVVTGTPPIATIDHRVDGVGSTVLLDAAEAEVFWRRIRDGEYPPGGHVGGWG